EPPADLEIARRAERLNAGDTGEPSRRLLDQRAHADAVLANLPRMSREPFVELLFGIRLAAVHETHHLRIARDGGELLAILGFPRTDEQAFGLESEHSRGVVRLTSASMERTLLNA